jgi:quinol monooxygenase YgiN
MKKVLSFIAVACVALLIYSCNCGSKNKKAEGCCEKEKTEACCKEKKTDSCCKEGHKIEIKKIVITAYLDIKTDKIAKFLTDVQEVITKSKAEEGNVSYNLFTDPKEKNKFVFIEEWKDQSAIDIHFATEHFKKFNTLMEEVAAAPAQIKIFEVANEK